MEIEDGKGKGNPGFVGQNVTKRKVQTQEGNDLKNISRLSIRFPRNKSQVKVGHFSAFKIMINSEAQANQFHFDPLYVPSHFRSSICTKK